MQIWRILNQLAASALIVAGFGYLLRGTLCRAEGSCPRPCDGSPAQVTIETQGE